MNENIEMPTPMVQMDDDHKDDEKNETIMNPKIEQSPNMPIITQDHPEIMENQETEVIPINDINNNNNNNNNDNSADTKQNISSDNNNNNINSTSKPKQSNDNANKVGGGGKNRRRRRRGQKKKGTKTNNGNNSGNTDDNVESKDDEKKELTKENLLKNNTPMDINEFIFRALDMEAGVTFSDENKNNAKKSKPINNNKPKNNKIKNIKKGSFKNDINRERGPYDGWNGNWLTPKNYKPSKASKKERPIIESFNKKTKSSVVCVTSDTVMQQCLQEMGMRCIGEKIKHPILKKKHGKHENSLKRVIFRCFACFEFEYNTNRTHCRYCGSKTYQRVAIYIDNNGKEHYRYYYRDRYAQRYMERRHLVPKGAQLVKYEQNIKKNTRKNIRKKQNKKRGYLPRFAQ